MAEWEAEIRLRRNGRLVKRDAALGDTAGQALYAAHNDLQLWTQDEAPTRWPQDHTGEVAGL